MSSLEDRGFASMIGDRASAAVGVGVVLGVGLMGVLMKGVPTMSLTHVTERPVTGLRPMRAEVLSNGPSLVVRYEDGDVVQITYDPRTDKVKWRGAGVSFDGDPKTLPFDPEDLRRFRPGAQIGMLKPAKVATVYQAHGYAGGVEVEGDHRTPELARDEAAIRYADAVEDFLKKDRGSRG